jgi:hypothetical protein
MNKKKYDKAVSTLTKLKLERSLSDIMDDAEVAWALQRELISLIDYKDDAVQGELKLEELIDALNLWIIRLEVLEDAAKEVAKRSHKAIHERGRDDELEEDGEGYSDVEDVSETFEVVAENTQKERARLTRSRGRNGGLRAFGHTNRSNSKVVNKRIKKSFAQNRKVSCGE